jgi:hypothetical protein
VSVLNRLFLLRIGSKGRHRLILSLRSKPPAFDDLVGMCRA